MSTILHKRVTREFADFARHHEPYIYIKLPDPKDMTVIHFSILGPKDSPFEGGIYHGVMNLPPNYPFRPPTLQMITPNGRFKTDLNICLSNTSFHPESWSPAWGISTFLIGLRSLFTDHTLVGVGTLSLVESDIKKYAAESRKFVCPRCGVKHADLCSELKEE